MIYLVLLINSLFAQDYIGDFAMFCDLNLSKCSPAVVVVEDGAGKGFGSGSYEAEKAAMQSMVAQQERQQQEFTQNYIDNESARMKNSETQAKKNLAAIVSKSNVSFSSRKNSIDQFRIHVDTAESLKRKVDKYNQNINSDTRDYKKAVEAGEGIVYSNISVSFPSGYNSDGIFLPESVNSDVGKSPFSSFKPSGALATQQGQIIRRMANQYQASWGENSFFLRRSFSETSQYLLGASYVRLADEKFSSNPMQALSYLQMAKNILNFSEGVLTGVKDNIVSIVKMAPELANALKDYSKAVVNDPTYLVSSTYGLAMATPRLAAALVDHLKDQIGILENGSAFERGKVIGEYTLDILGMVASLGSSAVVSGARVGTVTVGKAAIKEFAEELATNPSLQKVISNELIPAVQEAIEVSNALKNATREQYLKVLELNLDLQKTGTVKITSDALEFTQKVPGTKGAVEWNHSVLIKDLNNVNVKTAEEANHLSKVAFESNPLNAGKQYQPSIKPNTKVFEYTTHAPVSDRFVRVYSDKNDPLGTWILDKSSIQGLTREQIQDKFALPRLPMYIADVDIPAGAVLRKSVPNAIFGSSGKQVATQFQIVVEKLPAGSSLKSLIQIGKELP